LVGKSSCTAGTLTPATCGPAPCTGHNVVITNGRVGNCLSQSLVHGASCQPTCNTGFTVSGTTSCDKAVLSAATCNPNSCDATNLVTNAGNVGTCTTTLSSGQTCQQVCNSGYNGSPSSCLNGKLTAGICSAKVCDATTVITNGKNKGDCTSTLVHGASCEQVCNTGYTLTSASSCMAGTLTAGACTPSACDASSPPTNGTVGTCTGSVPSGSTCQISCKTGYTASGTSSCLNGVVTSATCGPAPCDASTAPTNGLVGTCTNNLAHGSTCIPVCAEGFDLKGITKCSKGVLSPAKCKSGVIQLFIGMWLVLAAFIYV
jgi:hypothetical protein